MSLEILDADFVRKQVSRVQHLPALPVVVQSLRQGIQDPRSQAQEIAYLLRHDQALTARILRLANSAFYATREPITRLEQAVVLLGFHTVNAVIIKNAIFDQKHLRQGRQMWLHALGAACAARAIAKLCHYQDIDGAFVAGLLHDIGKLVLEQEFPEHYAAARELALTENILIREAELRIFKCSHASIGAILAERWSFPAELRSAIAYHHEVDEASDEHALLTSITHFSDIVVRALLLGNGGDNGIPLLLASVRDRLDINPQRMAEFFSKTEAELTEAEVFFTFFDE